MLFNIASAAVLAATAAAIPTVREQKPAPPQAALRPVYTKGMENTSPKRPEPTFVLPTGEGDESSGSVESILNLGDVYTFWQGSGSSWPNMGSWGSFDDMWSANVPLMKGSCGWNGWGADNSDSEISDMRNALLQVSENETGLDPRFILAVIMQETGGCVRAPTTWNGVTNPGLMQSHNGSGSCSGVNPCPYSSILQMIRDGSAGTSSGDGLRQCLAKTQAVVGSEPARAVFAAARMYNSGSVDYNDLNNAFGSTKCYSCDVCNRLTGWTFATRTCS